MSHSEAERAAAGFCLPGPMERLERHDEGLIHDTYRVTCRGRNGTDRFILQRINSRVFVDPAALMAKIERVVSCLRNRATRTGRDPSRSSLQIIRTQEGASWLQATGDAWRMFRYIEGTKSVSKMKDAQTAFQIGSAFGRFLSDVSELSPAELAAALPGYRDTARYMASFQAVLDEDRWGRVGDAADEIEFLQAKREAALRLQSLQAREAMHVRVIHGDTKMSNVLLDVATGEAVCVIDLDTVMPGLRLHDLGDCMREALVCSDMPAGGVGASEWKIIEGILLGFFSELRPPPTDSEITHVVTALVSITLELATRFLADYLAGDTYFRVSESRENLRRAQRHIRLARNIEGQRTELEGLVLRCAREAR